MPVEGRDPEEPETGFSLIETMLWTPGRGYFLFEAHMERLVASARVLNFRCNAASVRKMLLRKAGSMPREHQRVKLLLNRDGSSEVTAKALEWLPGPWRVAVSRHLNDPGDPLLRHKTTRREIYDAERAKFARSRGCDEVLFFNVRGELCEGSFTNVFVRLGRRMLTPAVECGLLPGIYRNRLLEQGIATGANIGMDELAAADAVYAGNSVRGLVELEMLPPDVG